MQQLIEKNSNILVCLIPEMWELRDIIDNQMAAKIKGQLQEYS